MICVISLALFSIDEASKRRDCSSKAVDGSLSALLAPAMTASGVRKS